MDKVGINIEAEKNLQHIIPLHAPVKLTMLLLESCAQHRQFSFLHLRSLLSKLATTFLWKTNHKSTTRKEIYSVCDLPRFAEEVFWGWERATPSLASLWVPLCPLSILISNSVASPSVTLPSKVLLNHNNSIRSSFSFNCRSNTHLMAISSLFFTPFCNSVKSGSTRVCRTTSLCKALAAFSRTILVGSLRALTNVVCSWGKNGFSRTPTCRMKV